MNNSWRLLKPWESELVERLLSAEFPGRDALHVQAAGARAKTIDEEGSFAFAFEMGDCPKAGVKGRIPVEAESVDTDGVPIHALLHVVDGSLKEVEILREDSKTIIKLPAAVTWKLFVPTGSE